MNNKQNKRVLMAMSGGVDSSVSALLLHDAGYDVCGCTMKLFDNDTASAGGAVIGESSCCSQSDVEDARQVAFGLGLEHFTFNYTGAFGEKVIDKFCNSYLCGKTPNPCIDCNRYLKFQALQLRRVQLGYDYVATGHYARRVYNESTGRYELHRGLDVTKDQSYVLFHLTQDDLAHMLFPLGELTKPEVRELAAQHNFGNADKPESQDICFVPDGDYAGFIERYLESNHSTQPESKGASHSDSPGSHKSATSTFGSCGTRFVTPSLSDKRFANAFTPGEIVDASGKVLGQHTGLIHYTIGQRKGIGLAAPEPLYVVDKDVANNRLIVGFRPELMVDEARATDVNFIALPALDKPTRVLAKTLYRQAAQPGMATMEDRTLVVRFDNPIVHPAAGQALVLYDGETGDSVLCGGTII